MSLTGGSADNPDQRISEDINRFIDGGQIGYGMYSFSILLISNLSSLVSFAILLWDLSTNFTLPYTTIAVPGFLFWVALDLCRRRHSRDPSDRAPARPPFLRAAAL